MAYMKYAGMAFEMLSFIVIGYFLGRFIDRSVGTTKPYFMLGAIILMMVLYFVKLTRDLSSTNE